MPTDENAPAAEGPDPALPHPAKGTRWLVLVALLILLSGVLWGLFGTDQGRRLRKDTHEVGKEFRGWVQSHAWAAPAVFLAVYVAVALCLVPVWWLQLLAGYGFGMGWGFGYSLTGSVTGAGVGFLVSRLLAADWVREKFENRHATLKRLDEKMGHNGLAVVMATRLTHVMPFGASNYLFGLTRINLAEVLVGTLLGNIPAIAFYVAIGAGLHPEKDWRFMIGIGAVNVLLLLPIALRYWRPAWFRKIGVE